MGPDWKVLVYDEDKYKIEQISTGQYDIFPKKINIKTLKKKIIIDNDDDELGNPQIKNIIKIKKKKIIIGDKIEKSIQNEDDGIFDESYLKYLYPRLDDKTEKIILVKKYQILKNFQIVDMMDLSKK